MNTLCIILCLQVFPFIWVKYRDISTKIRNIPRTSDVDDLIDAAYDSPHFGTISGQILPYYRGEQLKRSTKLEDINDIDNTTEMDPILLDNSQQQQHGMYICYWSCYVLIVCLCYIFIVYTCNSGNDYLLKYSF